MLALPSRRRLIASALALLQGTAWSPVMALGGRPITQGINQLRGDVRVNGSLARLGQRVTSGDNLVTGANSEVVVVVGDNVFLQRSDSRTVISGNISSLGLRVVSGSLLSVFGRGSHQIHTATATVGIRGTGAYTEHDMDGTYFCLCYGSANVTPLAQPGAALSLTTQHHDRPLMIGYDGTVIPSTIQKNHTDAELEHLEALVGRQPPFVSGVPPTR